MAELHKINVNGELYDMSDSKARSDIASEITNRTNADNALQEKINTNKTGIDNLVNDVAARNVKAEEVTNVPEVKLPLDEVKEEIEAAGNRVLGSIPDDYTQINNKVSELKGDLANSEKRIYTDKSSLSETATGQRLNPETGEEESGGGTSLTDYIPVFKGDIICYKLYAMSSIYATHVFYDKNKSYVSGDSVNNNDTNLIAEQDGYVRFGCITAYINDETRNVYIKIYTNAKTYTDEQVANAKTYTDEQVANAHSIFQVVTDESKAGMYIYNGTLLETANGTFLELEAKKGDKYKITATTTGGYYVIQPNYRSSLSGYIKNPATVTNDSSNNTAYADYDIEIISDCTLIINCTNGFDFIVKKYDIFSTQEIVEYVENLKTESFEEAKNYTDEAIRSVTTEIPEINIGSKLFAVVGDTLQIFKKSIFNVLSDRFIFKISCPKGKVYPRYWEYTPTASDVGTTNMEFNVYNKGGDKVATKTVSLVTVNANNPSSQVNVMNIGDSTTYSGQTPIELSRRLKGTNGVATSPEPLALSNVNVNGRLKNADKSCGWEGTGGWTYSTYNGAGVTAVRSTVTNASNISVGDIIQINATNSKGYYRFQVEEVNVTSGSGELRCMFYQTPYTSTFLDEVSASGSLNNISDSTVGTYSSLSVEKYQPFWNNETDSFDITSYVNAYLDGHCEYIFILLGINNLIGMNPFNDVTNIFNDCKTLLNNIHSQLPNTKILLSTNPLISQNGGAGANYNANTNSGSFDENGWNHKIWSMNELYYTLESDVAYKDWVTVVNTHAQFDSEYGYPYGQYPVNIRMNNVKENRGTNAVHPLNEGYWMIADAEFRALLGLLS